MSCPINFDQKIAELEAELQEVRKEKEAFVALSNDRQLAILLHEILCHWNHTDGCSWHYEMDKGKHRWDNQAHSSYLKKAQAIIKQAGDMSIKDMITLFKIMEGI